MVGKILKRCTAVLMSLVFLFSASTNAYAAASTSTTESTTEEITTPPIGADFSDEKTQQDVWDVFSVSNWKDNRITLNFMLGDQGVAFSPKLDDNQAKDFQETFEKPLSIAMQALDDAEKKGKTVLSHQHHYRFVEYQKIVSCVLYCMMYRGGILGDTNWATIGDPNKSEKYTFFDIAKSIYSGYDDDQMQFVDAKHSLYLSQPFKDYWMAHGVKEEDLMRKFWEQVAYAFFGESGCTDLTDVAKIIVKRLTRYDEESRIFYVVEDEKKPYYFDVYKSRDMLNYVCIDGLFTNSTSFGYNSLFEQFLMYTYMAPSKKDKHKNLKYLVDEWNAPATNSSSIVNGGLSQCSDWGNTTDYSYFDFRGLYLANPDNRTRIPVYTYYQSLDPEAYGNTGYAFMFNQFRQAVVGYDSNFAEFKKSGDYDDILGCIVNTVPGGSVYESNGDGLGQFYYSEYVASKIVSHTINGVTGQVIDD